MLFWICLLLMIISLPSGIIFSLKYKPNTIYDDTRYFACAAGILLSFLTGAVVIGFWSAHASDLGTIVAQKEMIAVYEQQRNDLANRLDTFNYPKGSMVNADTPVSSIVKQLTETEKTLGRARARKAAAIRDIERRRKGPMSGVITMVGDYK